MGRKIQNIYDYLNEYTEKEIDAMINTLQPEEKQLITDRYGDDLHNPIKNGMFTTTQEKRYYTHLVPKMRILLAEAKIIELKAKLAKNTESNLKNRLLELINLKKSNKEIYETLNMNPQQLYSLLLDLKNNGMMISRKYYSDGSIKYKQIKTHSDFRKTSLFEQDRTIITDSKENNLKFLIISDLHFGNKLERLDLIDRAYNYCIKNGINIILSGGDLIDGTYTKGEQKISDLNKQIDYFIKNYPYDKNILTFSVAGDHDISAFNNSALNLIKICNNFRHDIVIGGYNNTGINIKNDQILLHHYIQNGNNGNTKYSTAPIILNGHYHIYKACMKDNSLNVTIPSISNICQPMPSALELDLDFYKGYINNAVIKHIYFGNQDIVLSESNFDLLTNRNVTYEPIRNIEQYRNNNSVEEEKPLTKKLQKPLSQIEKFNKRYGNNY